MRASVVIATIGRPDLLRECLRAIAAGRILPDETIVIAQGAHGEIEATVRHFGSIHARVVHDDQRGKGRAVNIGIKAARHDCVFFTDDDCTVAENWLEIGLARLRNRVDALVTGRVLPVGTDAGGVPSVVTLLERHEYHGAPQVDKLYGGNMAGHRAALLQIGGLDERVVPAAEDNDLCYRWLRAGGTILYDPDLVVWHNDWRDRAALRRVYWGYGVGHGRFYGKHLRSQDWKILRFVARDLLLGGVGAIGRIASRRSRSPLSELLWLAALPLGIVSGLGIRGQVGAGPELSKE